MKIPDTCKRRGGEPRGRSSFGIEPLEGRRLLSGGGGAWYGGWSHGGAGAADDSYGASVVAAGERRASSPATRGSGHFARPAARRRARGSARADLMIRNYGD